MVTQKPHFENNTMAKRQKRQKRQPMIDKTFHITLKLRNTNPTENAMNRGIPERKAVHAQLVTPLVLLFLQPTVRSLF